MCVDGCKVQYWHSCIVDSLSTMHAVLSVEVCVYICIGICKYSIMYIQ